MNRNLTNSNRVAILCLPCNSGVEFCSSFRQGDNTPTIKSVFLCPPFLDAFKFEVINSILMELFGQPLRLVSPCRDTANSNNFVAKCFAALRGGYPTFRQGITDDTRTRSNQANSSYLKQKTND
jgi:hypothetical protein